jgi:hypothetical protein
MSKAKSFFEAIPTEVKWGTGILLAWVVAGWALNKSAKEAEAAKVEDEKQKALEEQYKNTGVQPQIPVDNITPQTIAALNTRAAKYADKIYNAISFISTDEKKLYDTAREIVADIKTNSGMTYYLVAERFKILYQQDLKEFLSRGMSPSEYNHFIAILEDRIVNDYWNKIKEATGFEGIKRRY